MESALNLARGFVCFNCKQSSYQELCNETSEGFMTAMENFLSWERASRDTIDFKKIYADMAGDVLAGLALSELIYWYLPAKDGSSNKLRVEREGHMWIAVRRYEWWERVRISPDQSDRVINILLQRGLVEKKTFRFDGDPTIHIRIIEDRFLALWRQLSACPLINPYLPKPKEIPFSPNGENQFAKNGKTNSPNGENVFAGNRKQLTKSTTETTTENTELGRASAPAGEEEIVKNRGALEAIRKFQENNPRGEFDYSIYPEEVCGIIREFCKLWNHRPPARSPKKGGEFSLWISEARDLLDACGEFGFDALRAAHAEWTNIPIDDRWMVARPGSVVKIVRSNAAKMRSKKASEKPARSWEQFLYEWHERFPDRGEPTDADYQKYLLVTAR